jgi:Copine/C2 domain
MMQPTRLNARPGGPRGKKVQRTNRLAWDSRVTAPYIKLDLIIECHRLPKKDSFSQADAFCCLHEVPASYHDLLKQRGSVTRLPTKQEKEIGRTEVVRGNKNPRFQTTFRLEYKFQEEQTYILRVYDEDLRYATDLKEHDFVGGTLFTLGELMGSGGCALARPLLRGRAVVLLVGQEIIETREVLEFRFSGQDLGLQEKKHKKVIVAKELLDTVQKVNTAVQKVNVAKNVLDKFNPFFRLEKLNTEDQSWTIVWKSEVIKDNQNPTWNVARLPLQLLCNDDPTHPLKITIWVWNRFAPEEMVGFVETTVSALVLKAKRGIPVFDIMHEKRNIFGGTVMKKAGTLKTLKASIVHLPSMLQYFAGCCEMDLMFAIDCSSTNKHWEDEKSLHFRTSSWMNDYQAAIKKIGTIFEAYDGKKEYTMWGYGAKVNGVYHPYFVMGDRLNGAASLLKAYDDAFSGTNEKNMKFTGKAELSHIVQTSMYRAIRSNQATRQCYSTLVILSTGEISDLQETVDAVCAAAEDAPLSIVIIGVGAMGNFERLQRLNGGDFGKLRHSNGVPIARDIVHFVKFSNFRGNANRCVSESLKEIPEQFVQHFLNAGIRPLPPKPIPDFSGERAQLSSATQGVVAVGF